MRKTWPATTSNDAFLSRPMRSMLKLPPPERRTGLAAHDFQVLLGTKDVVLTRSVKSDNAPTVASRWVQRLSIVVGEATHSAMARRGQVYLDWARQIDGRDQPANPCAQPRPRPPVAVRPEALAITDIETWITDPYAIYARRILKLAPLNPLVRQADHRERGELYHAIMEAFFRTGIDASQPDALEQTLILARNRFDGAGLPADIAATWWPRFRTIAAAFLEWQRGLDDPLRDTRVELFGNTNIGLEGFTLRGRVDRIDLLGDGKIAIFDYKTGTTPGVSLVKAFKSPQLPLEAAMAKRGAFGEAVKREAAQLGYIRLRPTNPLQVDLIGDPANNPTLAGELGEEAWNRLLQMIRTYRDPEKDYRSKARQVVEKNWEDDYDHLARVREWSIGDDDGDAT